MRRRAPASLLVACALGVVLGADALRGAVEMMRLGAPDSIALARGGALVAVGLACALTRNALLALAQVALAIWVYSDLAPVVGDALATGFSHARLWLRPMPLAALAFFPLAFFGWRALARAKAARPAGAP